MKRNREENLLKLTAIQRECHVLVTCRVLRMRSEQPRGLAWLLITSNNYITNTSPSHTVINDSRWRQLRGCISDSVDVITCTIVIKLIQILSYCIDSHFYCFFTLTVAHRPLSLFLCSVNVQTYTLPHIHTCST